MNLTNMVVGGFSLCEGDISASNKIAVSSWPQYYAHCIGHGIGQWAGQVVSAWLIYITHHSPTYFTDHLFYLYDWELLVDICSFVALIYCYRVLKKKKRRNKTKQKMHGFHKLRNISCCEVSPFWLKILLKFAFCEMHFEKKKKNRSSLSLCPDSSPQLGGLFSIANIYWDMEWLLE